MPQWLRHRKTRPVRCRPFRVELRRWPPWTRFSGLHGAVTDDLEGFRRGDPAAVQAVYRQYGRLVFSVASSITRDRELAADVVQETFVKAWKSADGFDTSRDLAPWLTTIARHTAIDAIRRENQQNKTPPSCSLVPLPPPRM